MYINNTSVRKETKKWGKLNRNATINFLGIVDSENNVIHFTGHVDGNSETNGLVQQTSITDFIKDYPFGVCQYGVADDTDNFQWPGTYVAQESDGVDKVLQRTRECLEKGFGEYQILGNSCEDFAVYCKTGQRQQSKAQLQATMTRVAATRSALEAGHKNPVVFAGCLFGWFNANDFEKSQGMTKNQKNCPRWKNLSSASLRIFIYLHEARSK